MTWSFDTQSSGWEWLKTVTNPADSSLMPNVAGDLSDLGRQLSETELLRCLDEYPDVALIVGPDGTRQMWGNPGW